VTPYRERLRVPALWWLLLAGFSVSLWLAYQHAYGPTVSVPVALGAAAVVGTGLIVYGRTQVAVQPDGFVAGRAKLPCWAIGDVAALDADAARAARGRDADPQAFLLLRSYAPRAVRVEVDDPADPVPYWLVSTRRPDELAAAIIAARDTANLAYHDHEDQPPDSGGQSS
jgi:hypothetical protein